MKENTGSAGMAQDMRTLYAQMEEEYDKIARALDFGCSGCPDNCCDSYFLHHTYVEWWYLWQGLNALDEEKQRKILERAHEHVLEVERVIATGGRPQVMCPLNEGGLCILYTHRLMVCRTHGIPAVLRRPDGRTLDFPGCFRCQEKGVAAGGPVMERTPLLQRLVRLETEFLGGRRAHYPKLRLTIAEMIVRGDPAVSYPEFRRRSTTL